VEWESEGILGGVGVGILGGVGVGRNFRWSRSRKEFLGGVGVWEKCTDSDSDLSLKS
jgi:hypothetical protein